MHDPDDRLAGDHIWELFTPPTVVQLQPVSSTNVAGTVPVPSALRSGAKWLIPAAIVTPLWFVNCPLAVAATCLVVAVPDIRKGRQFARAISVKAGGTICARFTYAWAAWKLAMAALFILVVTALFAMHISHSNQPSAEFMTALLLVIVAFVASSILTASSLVIAYRSGMKLWLGEGINRAHTLLTAMLIVAFMFVVLAQLMIWLAWQNPRASGRTPDPMIVVFIVCACMFIGSLAIVILRDHLMVRLLSLHPGKFGPKVPTVGHWNPRDHFADAMHE